MLQKIRKQTKGFTIIEVLIVLAIAGLILLIVFLAVPALQRNSRNTQRTNDVGRALGAAQEVINNSNGQTSALSSANLQAALGSQLSYYQASNITVSSPPGNTGGSGDVDTVQIRPGTVCGTGLLTGQAVAGNSRQLTATFRVETGGGSTMRCQDS